MENNIVAVVYFCLYAFIVTLVVVNLFISGLNFTFSEAASRSKVPGDDYFDFELSGHLMWRMRNLLGFHDEFVPNIQKSERKGELRDIIEYVIMCKYECK